MQTITITGLKLQCDRVEPEVDPVTEAQDAIKACNEVLLDLAADPQLVLPKGGLKPGNVEVSNKEGCAVDPLCAFWAKRQCSRPYKEARACWTCHQEAMSKTQAELRQVEALLDRCNAHMDADCGAYARQLRKDIEAFKARER